MHIRFYSTALIIGLLVSLHGCAHNQTVDDNPPDVRSKNRNVKLDDRSHSRKVVLTNGSVSSGNHAVVASIETINGNTLLGDDSKAEAISSVNGSISVGSRSIVARHIDSTNGAVSLGDDAYVQGAIRGTNTSISLGKRARAGQIIAVNGDVTLEENARVDGSIEVKKIGYNWFAKVIGVKERIPVITIGPDAQVGGDMTFTGKVVLRVHSTAKIGPVKGATVEVF